MRLRIVLLVVVLIFLFFHNYVLSRVDKDTVSLGTAWFINSEGYLVTAYHVIKGRDIFYIKYGNKYIVAKVIGYDSTHDLALLKTDLRGNSFLSLEFSRTETEAGKVYGYPSPDKFGYNMKESSGYLYKSFFEGSEIHANIYTCPGNSGGPIIGKNGVVAVVSYTYGAQDNNNCSSNLYGPKAVYIQLLASKYSVILPKGKSLGVSTYNVVLIQASSKL